MTSRLLPAAISLQLSQTPHGVTVGPFTQLSAFARMRAVEVLPTPRGPDEKISVRETVLLDRVLQRLRDMILSHQIVKRLRPIFPREDLVAHASNLNALNLPGNKKSITSDSDFLGDGILFSLMTTSGELEVSNENSDGLSVFFLAEGEQTAESVLARLTSFISEAKQSLDFAVYDMRLDDPLKNELTRALADRAKAGVEIRICYDGDKPLQPNLAGGQDPAPPGTGAFVQSLGYPWRRIAGMKLMHQKFIVRDSAAVWTGSLNLTNDAFTLMENNVVEINSPDSGRLLRE